MKFLKILTLSFLLLSPMLYADLDEGVYSKENNPQQKDEYPFTFSTDGNLIGKSKFKKSSLNDQHLKFHLVDANFNMVFYYDREKEEGLYADLGYTSTLLDWEQNPFFTDDKFNTVSLTVGGFTERLDGWHWLAQATVHVDPIKNFKLTEYTYYDMTLWGRYTYCQEIGLNIGLLVQTGMKIDRIYPILGVDWKINNKWKINAIFPVNVSAIYQIDKCWSVALAARTFDIRHRVGQNEPLSRALFTYRNLGGEVVLGYDCDSRIVAHIHAGYTTGGMLKIADRHYENKRHFKFEGAPYGGADLIVKF